MATGHYDVAALHKAIEAVCPIFGVAIVDPVVNATWRIDYTPDATEAQQQAAQDVVDGWTLTEQTFAPPPSAQTVQALESKIEQLTAKLAELEARLA